MSCPVGAGAKPRGAAADSQTREQVIQPSAMRISILAPAFILLAACSKPPSTPPTTTTDPVVDDGNTDVVDPGIHERPELTAQACEAQGGEVIGDIGDGSIHQPEYRCPDSGEAPIGSVVADPDGPIAIEGAVCCK
jgi:hypothetical protein